MCAIIAISFIATREDGLPLRPLLIAMYVRGQANKAPTENSGNMNGKERVRGKK